MDRAAPTLVFLLLSIACGTDDLLGGGSSDAGVGLVEVIDFGSIGTGEEASVTFEIGNSGEATLFLRLEGVEAPFHTESTGLLVVEPREKRRIALRFEPQDPGEFSQLARMRVVGGTIRHLRLLGAAEGPAVCEPVEAEDRHVQLRSLQDLLFVVEDGPQLETRQAEVEALARAIPVALADSGIDARVAVTTAGCGGGGLLPPDDPDSRILVFGEEGFEDALAERLAPPTCEEAGGQALASALVAIEDDSFRRPGAVLHLVFVSDRDDASHEDVATLGRKILEADPEATATAVLTEVEAPRFDSLLALLSGERASLDDPLEAATRIADIRGGSFGVARRFALREPAVDSDADGWIEEGRELVVLLDGAALPPFDEADRRNWEWIPAENAVHFYEHVAPTVGTTLEFRYFTGCSNSPSASSVRSTSDSSL